MNKNAITGQLARGLICQVMIDIVLSRYPIFPEPKMWFQGRDQIDVLWMSEDEEVANICFLPFGFGLGGHIGVLLYTPLINIVVEIPLKIPCDKVFW